MFGKFDYISVVIACFFNDPCKDFQEAKKVLARESELGIFLFHLYLVSEGRGGQKMTESVPL